MYDRLMDSLPTFGSGSGTSTGRVWYEAATTQLNKMSDIQRGRTEAPEVHLTADISEVVAEIRSNLSLQIKELAEILGVERPTVYSWLRGEAKPQRSNRPRLSRVLQVALAWKRESETPIGNAIREALDDAGRSVLDDLRSESFDADLIVAKLRSIKQKADADDSHPRSILDLARELGFDKSKVRQQHDVLDIASGRRMHEE
ncbi:MAG: helix-turn-helix domain-containing protein [Pirellulales bacterium]